jgi:hypothetical protein
MNSMPFAACVLGFVTAVLNCACEASDSSEPPVIAAIRRDLPSGWQCDVVKERGKTGHPHGLAEPLFRVDFTNPQQAFESPIGKNPCVQLYFYDIAEKGHVLQVIKKEAIYSWNVPEYFGETKDYIVATSASYINHGVFTEQAKQITRPLWKALRKHVQSKEKDKTIVSGVD